MLKDIFQTEEKWLQVKKMYLHKGMVFTRPGNYVGKYTRFLKK